MAEAVAERVPEVAAPAPVPVASAVIAHHPPPFLTDAEVAEICSPLTNGAAQVRYLQRLGMVVQRKPNGRPLVARAEVDRVFVGRATEAQNHTQRSAPGQPDRLALLQFINGGKRGAKAQGR